MLTQCLLYAHLCVKYCVGQKACERDLGLREFIIVLEDHDSQPETTTMQDSYNVKVCVNNGRVGVPERWKCAKPGEVEEGKLYVRNWLYIKKEEFKKRMKLNGSKLFAYS